MAIVNLMDKMIEEKGKVLAARELIKDLIATGAKTDAVDAFISTKEANIKILNEVKEKEGI